VAGSAAATATASVALVVGTSWGTAAMVREAQGTVVVVVRAMTREARGTVAVVVGAMARGVEGMTDQEAWVSVGLTALEGEGARSAHMRGRTASTTSCTPAERCCNYPPEYRPRSDRTLCSPGRRPRPG
jgi:hypothetical protein